VNPESDRDWGLPPKELSLGVFERVWVGDLSPGPSFLASHRPNETPIARRLSLHWDRYHVLTHN